MKGEELQKFLQHPSEARYLFKQVADRERRADRKKYWSKKTLKRESQLSTGRGVPSTKENRESGWWSRDL